MRSIPDRVSPFLLGSLCLLLAVWTSSCVPRPGRSPLHSPLVTAPAPTAPSPASSATPRLSVPPTLTPSSLQQWPTLVPRGSSERTDSPVPLESNLFLSFEESGGDIALDIWTERIYGCYNYEVVADLAVRGSAIKISIEGVYQPQFCQDALGPARQEVKLGQLDGAHNLVFIYQGLRDRYRLAVSSERITITPKRVGFTRPIYETWLRLPQDAIWIVAEASTLTAERTPTVPDRAVCTAEASRFFSGLEEMGAERFNPQEGIYSNSRFVAPWPGWSWDDRGYTYIPITDNSGYLFKWPDIRYYHYPGSATQLQGWVVNYQSQAVWITAYTWRGERYTAR
jgi:hypothetical protein